MSPRRRVELTPERLGWSIDRRRWTGCQWESYSRQNVDNVEITLAVDDAETRVHPEPDASDDHDELTAADHIRQALAHLAAATEVQA